MRNSSNCFTTHLLPARLYLSANIFIRMPSEHNTCPTVLLSDRVASEDAFHHEAIAHAIAEMMLEHRESGCAVALIGSWGSGKSTVVEFLSRDLALADEEFETFIFDAWAHQGDPLRRTFLEKLIGWFQQKSGWTKEDSDWQGTLKELAKRKEKTTTENRPHLTPWAIAGALALLVVPVALQTFQKLDLRTNRTGAAFSALIALLPFLIGIVMLRNWWIAEADKPKEERKPIPSVVFSSLETTVTSETSKDGEPTSVEFERWYRKLVGEALQGNDRRLLVVLDNLDRIPRNEALSIWSTLRIFFDRSHHDSGLWQDRVWVLIPFDQEAIASLWGAAALGEFQNENRNGETSGAPSLVGSQHFLEKTFQVTFQVPPVVLLGWRAYLIQQLRIAFPDPKHDEAEFQLIYRLYDRLSPRESVTPTPRNIKIFINDVGAIHRQWQDTISLAHQAAFVLISKNKSTTEVMAVLRGGASIGPPGPGSVITSLVGAGWERYLSAILFNVPVDQSLQALLNDPISQALARGEGVALAALERNPGFGESLEAELETRFIQPARDGMAITRAILAFSELKGGWKGYERCSALLLRDVKSIERWDPFDSKVVEAIKSILKAVPDTGDLEPILRGIASSLRGPGQAKHNVEWLSGVAGLLPALVAIDEKSVVESFRLPGDVDQYIELLADAEPSSFPRKLLRYLQPSFPISGIERYITGKISAFGMNSVVAKGLQLLPEISPSWTWDSIASALRSRIRDYQQPPQDLSNIFQLIYELLPNRADLKESLVQASKTHTQFQLLHFAAQARDAATIARCALPIIGSSAPIPRSVSVSAPNTPQWRAAVGQNLLANWMNNNGVQGEQLQALAENALRWCSAEEWRQIGRDQPPKNSLIGRILQLVR